MTDTVVTTQTRGHIDMTTYVELDTFSWGVADLLVKTQPGLVFFRRESKLQIFDHFRAINQPTPLGQKLADLLAARVEFITYLTYNSHGFIQVEYSGDYSLSSAVIDAPNKVAEVIADFDRQVTKAVEETA